METASLLKAVIQNQLISNSVVKLCVPEFLMRLTDTRGEIRAAYSTLLEVVPTCVITRWGCDCCVTHPPVPPVKLQDAPAVHVAGCI